MSGNRRTFLKRLGAGAVAGTLAPLAPAAALAHTAHAGAGADARHTHAPLPGGTRDEAYWEAVKARFALDGIIPLNAANLGPSPAAVTAALAQATRSIDGDPSFQNRARFDELREHVRARIAAFLGAQPDEIALVRNTTEANNIVASGLVLGRGDEVVLHAENHPSNAVAWDVRAARSGFTVTRVAVSPRMSHDEMLAAFAAAFTPRTRVVSFTDVSNVTGIRLPARELCALARARGIHAHVDGAQSFGVLDLDLHALGCDSYAASGHKWFMGPKETGVLYVRAERAAAIWPNVVGVGWGSGAEPGPVAARRFETLGQRDDATLAGLDAALDLYDEIGKPAVERRVLELATWLKHELAALPAVALVTPPEAARSAGVVIASLAGRDARPIYERLYREYRISAATTGGLRFCPHVYTPLSDLRRAVDAVSASL
jgi:isopenicillin-N epimerase